MEKFMEEIMIKAETLIEALPYIRDFNGKTVVVKYGGSAMVQKELEESVMKDVVLLKLVGMNPVIVHGGGKEISRWVELLGKTPEFVGGFRVTDEETMEVAEMVLNKVNKHLVQFIETLGVSAAGITGKDGCTMIVDKKYVDGRDIGYVGDVKKVNTELIETLINNGFIPIIAPIGLGEDGMSYNINADDAACAIAAALHAEKLAFMTDTEGVLLDVEDRNSLISVLTLEKAEEMISSGAASGGMIPKLLNCINAVKNGVNRVHILDGRRLHCLLLEFFTRKGIGTAIVNDEKVLYSHEIS